MHRENYSLLWSECTAARETQEVLNKCLWAEWNPVWDTLSEPETGLLPAAGATITHPFRDHVLKDPGLPVTRPGCCRVGDTILARGALERQGPSHMQKHLGSTGEVQGAKMAREGRA